MLLQLKADEAGTEARSAELTVPTGAAKVDEIIVSTHPSNNKSLNERSNQSTSSPPVCKQAKIYVCKSFQNWVK